MLDKIPCAEEMIDLVGQPLYDVWEKLCATIDEQYDMEHLWNSGGKAWTYEYKYRKGSKTLCALYAKKDCIGFMVISGKTKEQSLRIGVKVFLAISKMYMMKQRLTMMVNG